MLLCDELVVRLVTCIWGRVRWWRCGSGGVWKPSCCVDLVDLTATLCGPGWLNFKHFSSFNLCIPGIAAALA